MDFEYSTSGDPAAAIPGTIGGIIVGLILLIALFKVFGKAGRPGWWAIIPILNTFQLVKIGGYGIGMFIALLIPGVNVIAYIILTQGIAKNFGKSGLFGFFGLVVFSFIGWLVLGFGSAQYTGERLEA